MSPFESELKASTPEMVDTFGQLVFVRGIEYKAIFEDEEFEDETGYRRVLLATFNISAKDFIKTGDSVFYAGECYTVGRLPRENTLDQLYTVELKRA